jgi:putative transposase
MTQPRQITPGMTVMVTRRTVRRTHLFRPDKNLNGLFVYCLAVLAAKHDILIHAVTIMSTHEHIVLTDPYGRRPHFLRELHRILALGVKVLRKWEGAVWDNQKASVVELCTPQAIVEKIAYVIGNPVEAGLVEYASQWPGLITLPEHLGEGAITARRPDFFFDKHNPDWPEEATLLLSAPPTGMPLEETATAVRDELAWIEDQARLEARDNRRSFLSPNKIRSLSPFARARSLEPIRSTNPTFAVGRGGRDVFFQCVARLRAFRDEYREALKLWKLGVRNVVFPCGTWIMSVVHKVATAA